MVSSVSILSSYTLYFEIANIITVCILGSLLVGYSNLRDNELQRYEDEVHGNGFEDVTSIGDVSFKFLILIRTYLVFTLFFEKISYFKFLGP